MVRAAVYPCLFFSGAFIFSNRIVVPSLSSRVSPSITRVIICVFLFGFVSSVWSEKRPAMSKVIRNARRKA